MKVTRIVRLMLFLDVAQSKHDKSDDENFESRKTPSSTEIHSNSESDVQEFNFESRKRINEDDMENAVSQRKVRKTVDLNPNPAAPLQITDSEKNKKPSLVVKTEDDKIPLPNPFPLPKYYPHNLGDALAKGELSLAQKQEFFSEVASSMLRYKRYPDKEDYICVASSIISKYPFFKQETGRPYDPIVRTLIDRFKQFRRKKKPRNPDTNIGKDTTPKRKKEDSPVLKKSPGIMKSLPCPQPPAGEDDISFERHTKVLQVQYGKSTRNRHIVNDLQDRTFAMRRKEILEKAMYLDSIFEKFPFLQEADELMTELQRILEKVDRRASSREQWRSLCPKILSQAELEAPHNLRISSTLSLDQSSSDISIVLALTLLALMLPDTRYRADPDKIICFTKGSENVTGAVKDISNLTPYVVVVGDITDAKQSFLVVDKKILCEIEFEDIPFCLMAAFFVFNICYPRGCSNFYSFMEIMTLEFPLEKASATVKHFIASIN